MCDGGSELSGSRVSRVTYVVLCASLWKHRAQELHRKNTHGCRYEVFNSDKTRCLAIDRVTHNALSCSAHEHSGKSFSADLPPQGPSHKGHP